MMKDLIVLMAWHQESDQRKVDAYHANRDSFINFNEDIEVITVMSAFDDPSEAWLGTDVSIFQWYIANKENHPSKRYLIVEWDCWCNCNLLDYYSRVLDLDLVVPNVKYPERDDWYWFSTISRLPLNAQSFACGITPLCGILMSKNAIDIIAPEVIKSEYAGINSELRLGTIATMKNFDPIVNPVYNRSINWKSCEPFDLKYTGLHHPRKILNI